MSTNQNLHEHESGDPGNEEFLNQSRDEIWKQLSVTLDLQNAIYRFAKQRKLKNRRLVAAVAGFTCAIILLFAAWPRYSSPVMNDKIAIGDQVTTSQPITANLNSSRVDSVTKGFKIIKKKRHEAFRHTKPFGADTVVTYNLATKGVEAITNQALLPSVKRLPTAFPDPHLHKVSLPDPTTLQNKRIEPLSVSENDIWDVLQRKKDKEYLQKQRPQADSIRKQPK